MPDAFVDIEHEGARGVGGIGDVEFVSREFVDEPGVDGAEAGSTGVGGGFGFGDIFEDPGDFGAAEVGVENEPSPFAEDVGGGLEFFAALGGASALPDDGVVEGLTCLRVPNNGGLSLVGDANRIDVAKFIPFHDFGDELLGDLPDFFGVVFDPARLRVMLSELRGPAPHHTSFSIEELKSDASRTCINSQYIFAHGGSFHIGRPMLHEGG